MKAIILVIDFINDIVHPDGKTNMVSDYVSKFSVIEKANQAIAWGRDKNFPIVHVKVGFSKGYLDCPLNSPMFAKAKANNALLLGTWNTEFHADMDVKPEDYIVIKHRVSALYATNLANILSAQQIDTVYVSGISTNMAVELVSRELHDRDFNVIVIADACGAVDEAVQQASLNSLGRLAKIINVVDLK